MSIDYSLIGIFIFFVCFTGDDRVVFIVLRVRTNDVLINVYDGFHWDT